MANTIDNLVIQNDGIIYRHRYLVVSDGTTAMTDVIMVDKSTLTSKTTGLEPVALDLIQASIQCGGAINSVVLEWDRTADDEIIGFGTTGMEMPRNEWGVIQDPVTAGGTGDVVVTTNGLSTGAWFQILATWELRAR